jgi:hypothetical protein
VRVDAAPPRPGASIDADGWFDAYFDGNQIRFAEGFRSGVDQDRVRSLAICSLRDALAGNYLPERPVPLDLDQSWHVLRVQVHNGFGGIGGGPLGASDRYLTSVRALADAAVTYLSA